jgi:predicted sulfurtransferase
MYCTGGIRCDVYSAALRQKGFKNLFTLHGGIQNYLREEGNEHWNGSLFVFDGRMAINPALHKGNEGEQQQCQRCSRMQQDAVVV